MSVQKRTRNGRSTYRVRWLEDGRQVSKTFDRKRDADLFDAEVTRRRQLGTLHTLSTSRTLDAFVREAWAPDRAADLATATRGFYASLYRAHIAPTFADVPLRSISAPKVAAWRTQRQHHGAGAKALREAHVLLGGILGYACELGELEYNAARAVRPTRRRKGEPVRPWPVAEVERVRVAMFEPEQKTIAESAPGQRRRRSYVASTPNPLLCARDAALVSVLATQACALKRRSR